MSRRTRILAVVALTLVAWLLVEHHVTKKRRKLESPSSVSVRPVSQAPTASHPASTIAPDRSPLADKLNAPDTSIAADLEIVSNVIATFRTNFLREGNPVGENAEITSALTGKNSLGLALIPADHPSINAHGELCDRWGTPFFFHQLSGTAMEIRSAGPDREMHTADDAVLTP